MRLPVFGGIEDHEEMSQATINIGIIGLGFMGRTHIAAYLFARDAGLDVRVVAACDRDASRFDELTKTGGNLATTGGLGELSELRRFHEPSALLSDPEIDAVSICTHTHTHIDLAIAALRAGKHVLVEKPVATKSADVRRLAEEAANSICICMPAMCMRFWPAWTWLRERVTRREFGDVRSAAFQRLASPPTWSTDFYRDTTRSGAALFDLHIHDVDFVYALFGRPRRISSAGSIHHLTTTYHYPAGPPHVIAEGGWDHATGFPFQMRFTVCFEHATAEFDLRRPAAESLMLWRDGKSEVVTVTPETGYVGEIIAFIQAIQTRGAASMSKMKADTTLDAVTANSAAAPPIPTIADALAVTEILEAEWRSLETGASIEFAF